MVIVEEVEDDEPPGPVGAPDDAEEPIFKAAMANDVKKVLELFVPGKTYPPHGWDALHVAAGYNATDVIDALLGAKANVDSNAGDGETPLHLAAQQGAEAAIRSLVSHGADVGAQNHEGETALHLAVQHIGSKDLGHIQALLELKADPSVRDNDDKDVMAHARVYSNRGAEIQEILVRNGYDPNSEDPNLINWRQRHEFESRLHAACWRGQRTIVEQLLETAQGDPLVVQRAVAPAAAGGSLDVMKALIAARADVTDPQSAESGMPPLIAAAEEGSAQMVKFLLAQNADPAVVSKDGKSALMAAASSSRGSMEVANALLTARTDVNYKSSSSSLTALMVASQSGNTDVARLLLDGGADLGVTNAEGLTARDFAVGRSNSEIVKIMDRFSKITSRRAKAAANKDESPAVEAADTRDLDGLLRSLGEQPAAKTKTKKKSAKPESEEVAAATEVAAEPAAPSPKAMPKAKAAEPAPPPAAPVNKKKAKAALLSRLQQLRKQRAEIEAEEAQIAKQLAEL